MNRLLTPRQVAFSLGVSESSLKRWCDRGLFPVERTVGGHRRIPIDGVVRFLRERQHPVVDAGVLGLPAGLSQPTRSLSESTESLFAALTEGDVETTRRLVFEFYLAGKTIGRICDELIRPAMALVGERWKHGSVEVYEEHRATDLVVRTLHELVTTLNKPPADAPIAIGGSIEGDYYSLPTCMIELSLAELGWQATSLSSSLPFETILHATRKHKPSLLWISASVIAEPNLFVDRFNSFQGQLPTTTALIIGGRALTLELRTRLRYTAYCDNFQQLAEFCRVLQSNSSRASA